MRDFFAYSLVNILPRVLFPKDTETFLETVAGKEEGLPRTLMFADVFISASNLFDDCKSPSLPDWYQDDKEYDIVSDPPCNLALQSIMALRSQKDKEEKNSVLESRQKSYLTQQPCDMESNRFFQWSILNCGEKLNGMV